MNHLVGSTPLADNERSKISNANNDTRVFCIAVRIIYSDIAWQDILNLDSFVLIVFYDLGYLRGFPNPCATASKGQAVAIVLARRCHWPMQAIPVLPL
jgi:hypothetical protein